MAALAAADLPLHTLEPGPHPAPPAAAPTVGEPLPDLADWEAQHAAALSASARRRSFGASDVLPADEDDDIAAGTKKHPRELELPPWNKGRYGTAIGRAVHGVLQSIDVATGAGLDHAVAAQAAAEGVLGREADLRRLVAAALDAPTVREAATRPRWRETYVATPIGDRLLEGYLDLLYRSDDGLVVVDYKTASTAADLDRRLSAYRGQGGAYALAVERATGGPVPRVVFIFLTRDGAVEHHLPDLPGAKRDVLTALSRS